MLHRRWSLLLPLLLLASLIELWPASTRSTPSPLSEQDRQFLYWTNEGALADAELSRLALKKARNEAVRSFAQRSLEEDERDTVALEALARDHGVSLPHRSDKEDRDLRDNMAATSGIEFDRIYMRNIIADIRRTIGRCDQQARMGRDPGLQGFVAEALPRLRRLDEQGRQADLALSRTAPLMSPSGSVGDHRPSSGPR